MYQGEYSLVGSELSFYTRKLEAQLRFQNIPWQWCFKTPERASELEARAGTHFIPLLMTPEKWVIHDTIALGPMLNDRFPDRPVIPTTPLQRSCCFILEDAWNHWLARSCGHTRWCYPDNVNWMGPRMAANLILDRSVDAPMSEQEMEQLSGFGQGAHDRFGKPAVDKIGAGADQGESMRADFKLMMEALHTHFAQNDFLLGPRPCLADFVLAGASKAHYLFDPEPLKWLGEHQNMLSSFTDRFFNEDAAEDEDWLANDKVPDTLGVILDYLQGSYFPYAKANVAAGLAGEEYYEYDYGFGPTRAQPNPQFNMARLHVRDELNRVHAFDNPAVKALFAGRGILEYYLED